MKLWSFIMGIVVLLAAVSASADEPYQKIRVLLPEGATVSQVLTVHPDLELMGLGDGDAVFLSRPSLTQKLESLGWKTTVLVPDLQSWEIARQKAALDYGIWHTYDETVTEMNQLHADFPGLTTEPFSIGTTLEGRTIWAIKLSDSPDVQEDEPEVLFDGVHHAREIMTVEMLLYYMRYLCENYGTDPVATFLLDNRQIYFVPIVNPDGFVYNQTIAPNGGGLWRKNRRNNGGGCYGVDDNRNYPYQWVGSGSSTDPCNDTYRGPSVGSEAETQAMMNLIEAHHFVTHDSFHSNAGMILFPWGYTNAHTPDDALLRSIAATRAAGNGYLTGQPGEILYLVNGGFFDWAYGEQTAKPKIFSFTTEIGGSDFWPDPSERDPLIAENLDSVIYLTKIAGASGSVTALAVSGGDGNGRLDAGEVADLVVTVKNDGVLTNLTNASVHLRCDDPYIALLQASGGTSSIPTGQTWTNAAAPFGVSVNVGTPEGRQVAFAVALDADGGVHTETPFTMTVGQLPVIAADDFESAGGAWIQDVTHTAATGAFVRVDPVATNFQPGDDTTPAPGVYAWITGQNPSGADGTDDVDSGVSATHSPDFDLHGYQSVRLSLDYFHGQRDSGDDPGGDFFRIDVSPDAGASWVNLVQIGDVATQPLWRNLSVELEDYIPLTSGVRFRAQASDADPSGDIIEGGVDEFRLLDGGSADQPPEAPVALLPAEGNEVVAPVTLVVSNAVDPEGDPLTYGFRIYADADLTDLVASADEIAEGTENTSWTSGSLEPGTYYWRAYAADPEQRGLYSDAGSFVVTATTAVPTVPPANAVLLVGPNPTRGGVRIRYLVPAVSTSRLAVYDPQGRLVRRFSIPPSAAGWGEVVWDGRDESGRAAASGSYWIRLWTPEETRTVRVVHLE